MKGTCRYFKLSTYVPVPLPPPRFPNIQLSLSAALLIQLLVTHHVYAMRPSIPENRIYELAGPSVQDSRSEGANVVLRRQRHCLRRV
ncbi:hypothetical protein K0M31_005326 [Melipona bicolor]|uniref:Uncharacterized protein n=1 Tax=Melipona bicolor TaxID=60889 RepID=A0AA40FV49_9HYME|nr:hypothetical protein K0M31_005326 [Melipona bicolor]